MQTKRKRSTPPLNDQDYDLLIRIIQGERGLEKSKKVAALIKRKQRYKLCYREVDDPVFGRCSRIVTLNGLILPRTSEVKAIISQFREKFLGSGARTIFPAVNSHYSGISTDDIQKFINRQADQTRVYPKFDNKAPLVPVECEEPMERIEIDLIDVESKVKRYHDNKDGGIKGSSKRYRYCLVILDVFSRFVLLRPLNTKTPECVCDALLPIFELLGTPKCVQCDNGGEFKGVMPKVCGDLNVKIIHGRPHHPQSQGKVSVI